VSGFHTNTTPAVVTWVVSLGAVIVVDTVLWRGLPGRRHGWRLDPSPNPWPRPGRGGAHAALRGVAPWLVLIAVALAWDVLGIDTGPHEAHLTVSALAQAYRPFNAALLLVWMLAGLGYGVARATAPLSTDAPPTHDPGTATALCAAGPVLRGHPLSGPALLLPSNRPVGITFWVAVLVAGVVIDLIARRSDGALADAAEFVRFISTSKLANVVIVLAWAYAGYHLFAH